MQSVNIFYDCCVNIILILAHLYLHGSRVCGDFHVTEVVKEENNAKPDPYGVCDLQNREMSGGLSCDLCVDTGKKCSHIYVIVKGHDGESGAEKGGKTYEQDFDPFPQDTGTGFVLEGDDKVGFSEGGDIQIRTLHSVRVCPEED